MSVTVDMTPESRHVMSTHKMTGAPVTHGLEPDKIRIRVADDGKIIDVTILGVVAGSTCRTGRRYPMNKINDWPDWLVVAVSQVVPA